MKNSAKKLPVFILTCLLFFAALLAPLGGGKASAASDLADPPTSIDETNVLDDLEGSILNGKAFNKDDFTQSDIRDPQIISLVEYGYSFYASRQDDYGLYVYIYNPRVQVFDNNSARNQIQLRAGDLASDKYNLQFLNYSTEAGYEGLFYKYKIILTNTEKNQILSSLQRTERIYEVTEFELSIKGVLTSYTCATKYTYKGFAQGYGSELATEGTLTCAVDGFEDYIELNVHQTVYRPQGDYYEGEQSQLNSCYFRVPKKFFTNYGDLTKIVCEWYEYITQPILVTTDYNLYSILSGTHGAPATQANSTSYFLIAALGNDPGGIQTGGRDTILFISNYPELKEEYGHGSLFEGRYGYWKLPKSSRFDNISTAFYTEQNYTDTNISSNQIEEQIIKNSRVLGGEYYNGLYSASLFSDEITANHIRGFNHQEITLKDEKHIFQNYTTKDFWQQIFGGYDVETLYDNVKAIDIVTKDMLEGNDDEIAKKLYVNKTDIQDIKNEFAKAKAAETEEELVLLRYSNSTYRSLPTVSSIVSKTEDDDTLSYKAWQKRWDEKFDGYIAQETVYLDFDIISLWFATENAETEIPVAMTPQNVFSPISPPLEENYHTDSGLPWWGWLILVLVLIVLIIVLVLFFPILRPVLAAVLKVLWWIVTAPFRFIAWIIKKISAAVNRRKEEKTTEPPGANTPKKTGTKTKSKKVNHEK